MIIYVDWDEHDIQFFEDDKLDETLESLKSEKSAGSRQVIQVNDTFDVLTPLAYNVDGEFGRST